MDENVRTNNDNIEKLIARYKKCANKKKKQVLYLQIIEKSIVTVKKLVNVIASQTGVNKEDLLQIGTVGLLKAIGGFDPDKNVSFVTYSTHIIKGEIWHYLRDKNEIIRPPRDLQELLSKVAVKLREIKNKGCPSPTQHELAKMLDISTEKLEEVLDIAKFRNLTSLDAYVFDENEYTPVEALVFDADKDYTLIYENRMLVAKALKRLPETLRMVVMMTYYGDKTQREIAQELNISTMRVSRYLKKALHILHKIMVEKQEE